MVSACTVVIFEMPLYSRDKFTDPAGPLSCDGNDADNGPKVLNAFTCRRTQSG